MCRPTCCVILLTVALGCNGGTATAPSKDPNRPNEPRKLTVKAPAYSKHVHQNDTNTVTVEVARENFNGPVVVEFRNLPAGVSVATDDRTIPVGKDTLLVSLKAAADAPPVKGHAAQIVAKATDEPDLPEAVVAITLDVLDKSDR